MSQLSSNARQEIKWAGLTIAGYIRYHMPFTGQDGRDWRGDKCGCRDDRCIDHHHDEDEDCGCLQYLIREYAESLA